MGKKNRNGVFTHTLMKGDDDVSSFPGDAEWRNAALHAYIKDAMGGNGQGIIRHGIDSFNTFVDRRIGEIVASYNPIRIQHTYLEEHGMYRYTVEISLDGVAITKPTINEKDGVTKAMLPNDARNRSLSYVAPLLADVHIRASTFDPETRGISTSTRRFNCVAIGKIPIMVKSRYCTLASHPYAGGDCRYDVGGYFIINGNEKVIISHDRMAENRTYVFDNVKMTNCSRITEVKSMDDSMLAKTTSLKLSARPNALGRYVHATIHNCRSDIPLIVLMRALGLGSDGDAIDAIMVCMKQFAHIGEEHEGLLYQDLLGSIAEASALGIFTETAAIEYISRSANIHEHMRALNERRKPAAVGRYYPTAGGFVDENDDQSERIEATRAYLAKDVLPHVGPEPGAKLYYLVYMIFRMFNRGEDRANSESSMLDDRDSYLNKRVDTPGVLLSIIFRQYYSRFVKDVKTVVMRDIGSGSWKAVGNLVNVVNSCNLSKVFRVIIIDSGLKYALATGNWGKGPKCRQGVAQMLNRAALSATYSHMRRTNTPMEKSGKLGPPRKLHGTQYGVICPAETPEGAAIGLVKNLSMASTITCSSSSQAVAMDVIRSFSPEFDTDPFRANDGEDAAGDPLTTFQRMAGTTRILVNGRVVACGPRNLRMQAFHDLKRLKRSGVLHLHTSISAPAASDEIHILTGSGRLVRPLFVVERLVEVAERGRLNDDEGSADTTLGKLIHCMTWAEMIRAGIVEYIDVEESASSLIATNMSDVARTRLKYQYLEIHPSLILGLLAGSIPFPDHNQSPRNTYQAAMGKQALGVYTSTFRERCDTAGHVLDYPQRPLVSTTTAEMAHSNALPSGVNTIVAIACYTGFNQEDSVILNSSAVERGMFKTTMYKGIRDTNTKNHSTGEEEYYLQPTPAVVHGMKPCNYGKLDASGFVPEGTYVTGNDVIIGKCMPQKVEKLITRKDTSIAIRKCDRGYIDRACHSDRYLPNTTGDGYTFAKIRIRSHRSPQVGDKFSSRHGQKGTVGMLMNDSDMPFSESDGIIPDMIINPHAIPSRMTVAQLLECIIGIRCCSSGGFGDGTPFGGTTMRDICEAMNAEGLDDCGDRVLINGFTGRRIRARIFMGPVFYQRLKHMVNDKMHSRGAIGPVNLMTRQPPDGRARDGGLREGEMEGQCNWAHGDAAYLKETMVERSDNYRVFVCRKCKMMSIGNAERNIYKCRVCNNNNDFAQVRIPYSMKLLMQELESMNIGVKIDTNVSCR